jgi:hypothetical protein
MATKTSEPVRPRSRTDTTTIEVDKDLKQEFKVAAVQLNVTLRELVDEALKSFRPQLEKRLRKSS